MAGWTKEGITEKLKKKHHATGTSLDDGGKTVCK